MKNFFDYDTKVKYIDNMLSKSSNWDWFIEYIEENFCFDFNIQNSDEFDKIFSSIQAVLDRLNKINSFIDNLKINKDWLLELNQLSLFSIGKLNIDSLVLSSDFFILLALYIYSAKIINSNRNTQYLIYTEIFVKYNIFEIVDIRDFLDEQDAFFELINLLKIDFNAEKNVFLENINKIYHPCTEVHPTLLELCDSYNAFSFSNSFNRNEFNSWEEQYLLDLLSSKCKNGKFEPQITYADGTEYPDFNKYTPDILSKMKKYFFDSNVVFLVESIDYYLHKSLPSVETINKHFKLLLNNINDYTEEKGYHHLMCSSLEFTLAFFHDDRIETNHNIGEFIKHIKKPNNLHYLIYLKKNNAPLDKTITQIIKSHKIKTANKIKDINNIYEFNNYVTNEIIVSVIDKQIFYIVSDKFEQVIDSDMEHVKVLIPSVFLNYLIFLINIKNNLNIISNEISSEIIYIRSLWKDVYYKRCANSMKVFESSVEIPDEDVENHNLNILNNPFSVAYSCLQLKDDSIVDKMKELSEHALVTLFTESIEINEDFPVKKQTYIDKAHPNDLIFFQKIKKLYKQNKARFLNNIPCDKYTTTIYEEIKSSVQIYFSLFNKSEELYNIIINNNKQYQFIDYNSTPLLAHVTQLFPIIETKIREIGQFFSISPICEHEKKYHKLKEPSSILNKIINDIYEETEDLSLISDFFFIHFTLFGENGFNIRNECIHGKDYNLAEGQIKFAFNISLFCLHLLDYRMSILTSIQ